MSVMRSIFVSTSLTFYDDIFLSLSLEGYITYKTVRNSVAGGRCKMIEGASSKEAEGNAS